MWEWTCKQTIEFTRYQWFHTRPYALHVLFCVCQCVVDVVVWLPRILNCSNEHLPLACSSCDGVSVSQSNRVWLVCCGCCPLMDHLLTRNSLTAPEGSQNSKSSAQDIGSTRTGWRFILSENIFILLYISELWWIWLDIFNWSWQMNKNQERSDSGGREASGGRERSVDGESRGRSEWKYSVDGITVNYKRKCAILYPSLSSSLLPFRILGPSSPLYLICCFIAVLAGFLINLLGLHWWLFVLHGVVVVCTAHVCTWKKRKSNSGF